MYLYHINQVVMASWLIELFYAFIRNACIDGHKNLLYGKMLIQVFVNAETLWNWHCEYLFLFIAHLFHYSI